jgi:hypothetical protein
MIRRDCRFHLRYGARDLCKEVWRKNILAEPKELKLGCPENCDDYEYASWKSTEDPNPPLRPPVLYLEDED